jgi:hypothetical protein
VLFSCGIGAHALQEEGFFIITRVIGAAGRKVPDRTLFRLYHHHGSGIFLRTW